MARAYLSVEEAATHLDVTTRTVRTYLKQGLLSSRKRTGSTRKWLDPDEVEELRKDRLETGSSSAVKIRGELLRHRAQIRRMRSELDAVMRILDTRNDPLNLRGEHALGIYQAALSQLKMTAWRADEIDPWVRVFFRISEEDFEAMMTKAQDPKPWVPFLKLVMRMTAHVVGLPEYATSLELQRLHRELAESRRRVRISAMCFMDLYAYDMDAAIRRAGLSDGAVSVQDELEAVLRRK